MKLYFKSGFEKEVSNSLGKKIRDKLLSPYGDKHAVLFEENGEEIIINLTEVLLFE